MADLKICVIGAGFAARVVHLPGYTGNGTAVAAICDLDTDRAQKLADKHRIAMVYSDWREMLNAEQPELVSVCLPNALHRETTIAALESGAHVLCEKPLATSVAEAHEMFDAAREAGRVLMAAQLYRYEANARAAKRIIESGALGEIYHVEVDAMRRLGIPTWGMFHQRSASVGGAMLDIGVHMLDQAIWLIGNPKPSSVSAVTQRHFGHKPEIARILGNTWDPEKFDVEDFSTAFVRFENGSTLVIRTSWAAHIRGNFFGISILGTEGGITTEPPTLFHTRNGVLADEEYRTLRSANTNELQMRAFLSALRGERRLPVQEEETMNVQRILNAAYRSAEEGREVPVED